MPFIASPTPTVEVVAVLSTATSRCEIRKRQSGDEAGDPIEAKCGATTKPIGRSLKGVTVDRISGCRVVLTVNAVHSPRLLNLSNCRGALVVTDIGSAWTKRLQKSAGINAKSVEFVSYEKLAERTGCYKVTVTYDVDAHSQNTAYQEKEGRFCIAAQ